MQELKNIDLKSNYMLINNIEIGLNKPTYFIADIGANHDGDIERAKKN